MNPRMGIAVLLALAASCQGSGPAERGPEPRPKEAWDGLGAPQVFGNVQSLPYQELDRAERLWGVLDTRPWSDDYWPWKQAGLARRWLLPAQAIHIDADAPDYHEEAQQKIDAFLAFARQADDHTRRRLSPLEKYDLLGAQGFPLTRKELHTYARYQKYYEDNDIDWAWMGSCDGWAIAARQVPAPRHAVRASTPGGEPVLFAVGDIRGLLSKAFTDNHKSRESQFLGTRCDRRPRDIARDERGRIVDGTLGRWWDGSLVDGRDIRIVYNNWRLIGHQELSSPESVIVFRYMDEPDALYWLRAVAWTDRMEEIVRVEVRPAPGLQLDPTVPAEEMDFRYLKSCRDLNAGAFHVVLAQLLSEAAAAETGDARGFVIEIARADEVWNHPVYGYVSRLGEPLDVQAVAPDGPQDPYENYRAPGTRYLVHAYTTVHFGTENGPLVVYGEGDELLARLTYQYTLELDADGYVIGGEWHQTVGETAERLTPLSGTGLLEHLRAQTAVTADAPDFLWRFPDDTRVLDTCNAPPCLSPATIYRLAACSRETPRAGDTVLLHGRTIPFVRCAL